MLQLSGSETLEVYGMKLATSTIPVVYNYISREASSPFELVRPERESFIVTDRAHL